MPTFSHEGLSFYYEDSGRGFPFLFQHGLGSDLRQTLALYEPAPGVRRISCDFRGHGQTTPLGDAKKIGMASYADDLIALLDHLGIDRAVVGGISLGAAVAMSMALRHPDRVCGLVVLRPAWVDRALPENTRVFAHVALHLLRHGPERGLELFRSTPEYQAIAEQSPATARSLEEQFLQPEAHERVVRLERIPHDAPCREREDLAAINIPTLVMGNRRDPIHPFEMAQSIAGHIPGATLVELTPKSDSEEQYRLDVQRALDAFFRRHFLLNLKSGS